MRKIAFIFAFLFVGLQVLAQTTINGTVTDPQGESVPGANVWVKGYSNVGTITDMDGKYSIDVPTEATTIGFSFMGMKTKEVSIGGQTTINVVLENEDQTIDDVVVTALGIAREKKSLGYSVQEVDGDDIARAKESNIVNSLSGKVAGVQIMGGQNIGGSSRILIRGANTIDSENQPLFVVDGMPIDNSNFGEGVEYGDGCSTSAVQSGRDYGNAAQDINPDDIESISVLKGPNATALYGSRGANGVILITTKKGKSQQGFGVTFSSGLTLSQAYVFPDLQNKYGGGRGVFINGEDGPEVDLAMDESWGPALEGQMVKQWGGEGNIGEIRPWVAHPDNYRDFFEIGKKYDNHLAISGNDGKNRYRMAYTRMDETGTVPNSKLTRNTFNLSLERKLNDKFMVNLALNYINTQGYGRPNTGGGSDAIPYNMVIWSQRQLDLERLEDYKYPDGSQRTWRTSGFGQTNVRANNPYWLVNEDYSTDERSRIIYNTGFTYNITDELSLRARLGQDWYADRRQDRQAVGSRYTPYYLQDQIE
ncbi:MAG: hypothetical protein B6I20_03780, partial [Bacteroidetes bacterium 4572_117]